jgi:predicted O-linked N-acetylglucosamine transferase (SPINDLY family)
MSGNGIAAGRGPRPAKIRVGFISAHVHDHSVFHAILRGWLECLEHRRFEVALFNLSTRHDACIEAAVAACDSVESGVRSVADWARCIRDGDLDALIFPEIGMNETTLALASLRLARQQFVAWGHPETSGLPTIDSFLSAELFEPPEAESHYAERLIKLPNLGVYCRPYAIESAAVDLSKLELDREGPLLICPGVPFKYRPHHDAVLVEIASRLGRCTFVFFDHEIPELSRKLDARLSVAFKQGGLYPQHYLKWIPWQPRASFFGLMSQADVYLDTIGFSGFNTMMQAVQCQLPCVTYAGRFMRGRLGSGILQRLGISELIARDTDEYIELAVRLAIDTSYRESIRVAMSLAEHRLYEDTTAIDALSELLLDRHA